MLNFNQMEKGTTLTNGWSLYRFVEVAEDGRIVLQPVDDNPHIAAKYIKTRYYKPNSSVLKTYRIAS